MFPWSVGVVYITKLGDFRSAVSIMILYTRNYHLDALNLLLFQKLRVLGIWICCHTKWFKSPIYSIEKCMFVNATEKSIFVDVLKDNVERKNCAHYTIVVWTLEVKKKKKKKGGDYSVMSVGFYRIFSIFT